MMEQLKLLSTSAILAILIWWGADSLVNETASLRASFEPVASPTSPDMRVALDGAPPTFHLEVNGPRRVLEDLRSKGSLKLKLTVPDLPSGAATIPLDRAMVRQAMADQWSETRKVSIVSVQPESLPVRIDHMISVELPIVARRFTIAFETEPQLTRSSAIVRMRESQRQALPPEQIAQLDIAAEIDRAFKDQPVGKSTTVSVGLDPRRFGPDAEVLPPSIDVTATVQALRNTVQIPAVPILIAVSASSLPLNVQPTDRDGTPLTLLTQAISVTGQRDEVNKLLRGESRAFGLIHLKQDDVASLNALKLVTPEYRLPKGIELAQDPQPIELKLISVSPTDQRTP